MTQVSKAPISGAADTPCRFSSVPLRRSAQSQISALEQELDTTAFAQFKGIGPWSVNMVAMRGCADPDAFPLQDLGIDKAWAALG